MLNETKIIKNLRIEANKKYYDQIKEFEKKNYFRVFISFLFPYFYLFSGIAFFYIAQNLLTIIITFFCFILSQRCFQTLVHDSAHNFFSKKRKINDNFTNIFVASSIGTNVVNYRNVHLAHHIHNGSEQDPEYVSLDKIKLKKNGMLKFILSYIFLLNVKKLFIKYYFQQTNIKTDKQNFLYKLFNLINKIKLIIIYQLVFLIFLIFIGIPEIYLLWIYISVSISPMLSGLRFMVEHPEKNDVTKTTSSFILERLFFAPFNFNYHFEHHAWPDTPPYNLKKLHLYLKEKKFFEDKKFLLNDRGYIQILTS